MWLARGRHLLLIRGRGVRRITGNSNYSLIPDITLNNVNVPYLKPYQLEHMLLSGQSLTPTRSKAGHPVEELNM
jgi:hypothetical protein